MADRGVGVAVAFRIGGTMQRHKAAILLLAALLGADVVLVTGAVRSTHVDTSDLARAMESADTPTATTGSTPPSGRSAAAAPTAAAPAGKVVIAGLTSTRAWRAASSSVLCTPDAKATIGHTEDGGKQWTHVTVPLTTVSGLSYADGRIIATGTDADCRAATYSLSSRTAPRTTTKTPTWAIDPTNPTDLLADGTAAAEQPCASGLLDVAVNSPSDVVALCGDSTVERSTDGGTSWRSKGGNSGLVAIATGSDAVFTASRAECGIAVTRLSVGKATNCVAGTKNWSGPIDMTIVGGTMWLATVDDAVTEPVAQLG